MSEPCDRPRLDLKRLALRIAHARRAGTDQYGDGPLLLIRLLRRWQSV